MTFPNATPPGTAMPAAHLGDEWLFRPRGIGLDFLPCFVCGAGDNTCQADMAAFVDPALAVVSGDIADHPVMEAFRAADMFAKLDYRTFEPN